MPLGEYEMKDLFGNEIFTENQWEEEWKNMPEYNNINQPAPFITATFKFKNQDDYDNFHKLIKQHLYNGKKVFDGMQSKEKKQAWFPLKEKASKYQYE